MIGIETGKCNTGSITSRVLVFTEIAENRVPITAKLVADLYAAANLLAHPTHYDPCSRVVLEALCCGLPVVTTRHNGAAEVMRAGVHGQVIDAPRDVESLRGAIRTCLSSQLRAACESDAAAMRERLSMSRHARELIALYETVSSAKRARTV